MMQRVRAVADYCDPVTGLYTKAGTEYQVTERHAARLFGAGLAESAEAVKADPQPEPAPKPKKTKKKAQKKG